MLQTTHLFAQQALVNYRPISYNCVAVLFLTSATREIGRYNIIIIIINLRRFRKMRA